MKKILLLIGIVIIIVCVITIKTDTVKIEGLTIEKLDNACSAGAAKRQLHHLHIFLSGIISGV